jgi:predicted RNase H-like nuclease
MRVAGIDGCRAGWAVTIRERTTDGLLRHDFRLFADFSELLADESLSVLAVDMPIGLPDRAGRGGRGPETAVRPLLGARQSSVFSVPSRAAVACTDYREACRVALESSDPPRKVSKQAFNLFTRIREIDALMAPSLEDRVFEVHPELAFWRLNGERPMSLPKKQKSAGHAPGIAERAELLVRNGYEREWFEQARPSGVGRDDLLDCAVNAVIAERIAGARAQPFPSPFARDGKGLRMAIWA